MTAILGFVSHAFSDAAYGGGTAAFRAEVRNLVTRACADFASDSIEVTYELFFEAAEYGKPLMPSIRDQIRRSDFLLADITQLADQPTVNPNVMYEIGFATALKKPILVMRGNSTPAPPSDIGDLLAGSYDSLTEIPAKFQERTVAIVTQVLAGMHRERVRVEPMIAKLWFPSDTKTITIICAREPEPSRFSNREEENYVHLDRFEDRDALIELATFFARRYPDAKVVRQLCDEVSPETLDCDLVVLGGPGCEPGEGNSIGKDFMRLFKSRVSYPEAGDGLVWGDQQVRETRCDKDGCVIEDWGAVLAGPNPYNTNARVILLHGTTTYGTLAAAYALIDSSTAVRNHLRLAGMQLEDRLTGAIDFEALVKAEVGSNRRVKPPALELVGPLAE